MRRLLVWLGFASTALFGYLALRNVDMAEARSAIASAGLGWLVPAFLVLALSIFIRAVRWRALFAVGPRPAIGPTTGALFIGYLFNNVLPARAGEVARVVALHQRAGTSRATTTGTVMIERAYDVLSLVVLLLIALPWLPEVSWVPAAAGLAGAVALALAALLAILARFGSQPILWTLRPLVRLPLMSEQRLEQAARNLESGLVAIRDPRIAVGAFLWTVLSWLVMALSFWLVMLAFELELSPMAALFVVIAVGLAMIIPSSPAALGVFEAATLGALTPYGITDSIAVSYGLVVHAVNIVLYLGVGGAVLVHYGAVPQAAQPRCRTRRDGLDGPIR